MLKLTLAVISTTLCLAVTAQAKSFDFEVESLMIDATLEKCTIPNGADFKVANVTVKEIEVDQGIHDYIYTTDFTVSYLGNDEETVVTKQIKVSVKKYQVSNPAFNPYELLFVTSTDKRICN